MDRLPLVISVPHAGLNIPPEVTHLNRLTPRQIAEDSDAAAREIYAILKAEAAQFVTTQIARTYVDLNRPEDDFGKDGVVKTHTHCDVPIYHAPLTPELRQRLLERYHHPYHSRLTASVSADLVLGVDCHTMAARGPPIGPDPGTERPQVCLSNADDSCISEWMEGLQTCFQAHFPGSVTTNTPYAGDYIIRRHGQEMPWVQLALSRGSFANNAKKSLWVMESLRAWTQLAGFSRKHV